MPKPLAITLSVIAVIVFAFLTWWFLTAQQAGAPAMNETASTQNTTQPPEPTGTQPSTADGLIVVFTDNGFEERNYTVKAGRTITVQNNSTMEIEFSSDEHPTHTNNPELNLAVVQPGGQRTFTPETPGVWGIHDHQQPQYTTTLTVTE